MFKTIEDCLNWLMARRSSNGHQHFKKVMDLLGNPQDKFKSIHVAGTNGKGSTVHFLANALQLHGFTVGTLQSPHFETHLDRIRVNGVFIDEKFVLDFINRQYRFILKHDLNMFEIDFIMMAFYFLEKDVDYAVIEVGLGGRLDSTNTLNHPMVCAITSIGYDHQKLLGDTLEQIAFEKAGIFKKSCHVFIATHQESVNKVFSQVATKLDIPMINTYITNQHGFDVNGVYFNFKKQAKYQVNNAYLAFSILKFLATVGSFEIDLQAVSKCWENLVWKGRFQIVSSNPTIILDGAHNIDGIQALVESLKEDVVFVFSAMEDKQYQKMIALLLSKAHRLFLTKFDNERNFNPTLVPKSSIIELEENYQVAYQKACSYNKTVVCCGSLYFISELYQFIQGENMHRPSYIRIDLDAFAENYHFFKQKHQKRIIPVLKANAYGLGDVALAKKSEELGVDLIAVSSLEEAIHLKENGIKCSILILGYVNPNDFELVRKYRFHIVTVDRQYVLKHDFQDIIVHIKIDTGMHRIGLLEDEVVECFNKLQQDKAIIIGAMTHYFDAGNPNQSSIYNQFNQFKRIVSALNYHFQYIHASNSDAALSFEDNFTNTIRIGLALVGLSSEVLKPVVSLCAKIISIREIKQGDTVGYSGIYCAPKDTKIATLAIGYADGYLRVNHNNQVYCKGYHNIVGNICMDQLMIEVNQDCRLGDEVELFGKHVSLLKLAEKNHLTVYEYLTLLSDRLLRIYKDGSKQFYLTPRFKANLELIEPVQNY